MEKAVGMPSKALGLKGDKTSRETVPVGKGGANRYKKVLRDNIQGITKPAIRRIAKEQRDIRGDAWCPQAVPGERAARFDHLHGARSQEDGEPTGCRVRPEAPGPHHLRLRRLSRLRPKKGQVRGEKGAHTAALASFSFSGAAGEALVAPAGLASE
ncbi:unnamed protein product [Prorocentrum cordatum]|uniref:Histone H4 n=1 Tax=Prorocentrum cordatum TaxID=2364126 RepID=A0ABN9PF41_9DINO|nr:unnamed protein product [Polarella glacialis]